MKQVVPFRATGKKRVSKPRATKDHTFLANQKDDAEDMITVLLEDGTHEMITGKNIEMDIVYQEGVPYLMVKKSH